ncbi:creatininase family protein [Methanopyrus sp.]
MEIRKLRHPEVDLESEVVLLPVGSTEQHGLHLPLGTDHFIAEALCREVSKRTGAPWYPVIPYGVSRHHMGFPGTVSLRTETMIALLTDLHRSFLHHGAAATLAVNGHGGNEAALGTVAEEEERFHWISWWKLAPTDELETDWGGHADELETSVMLYLYPELVGEERKADGRPTKPWEFPDYHVISETGTKGDPRPATADKGKRVFETVVVQLAEIVEELRDTYG